jgi:WD40 repeat protein
MAVTTFSPQILASGSTDGEICIWNTSSELFVRRLAQRKRSPNYTQTQVGRD